MSKLLQNKKLLETDMKVIYALSNIKVYPKCRTDLSFRYNVAYDLYPFSNVTYSIKLGFEAEKEIIEGLLKRIK